MFYLKRNENKIKKIMKLTRKKLSIQLLDYPGFKTNRVRIVLI
jgi:hypothetical protein